MKNISLKAEDSIFEETERLLSYMRISRNRYINDAIAYYNGVKNRQILEEKLKKESQLVSQESLNVLREFESIEDGDQAI